MGEAMEENGGVADLEETLVCLLMFCNQLPSLSFIKKKLGARNKNEEVAEKGRLDERRVHEEASKIRPSYFSWCLCS